MSDFKSKLPDFNELTSIASKFYKDVKTSVCEIIDDYKQKREQEGEAKTPEEVVARQEEVVTPVKPKKPKPTAETTHSTDSVKKQTPPPSAPNDDKL